MKKLYIILLLLLATFSVSAQQMPSVAGVTFGWSYEKCKEVLDKKFDAQGSRGNPNELDYPNISLGGYPFDFASFGFQSDGEKTYLYFISLYKTFELNEEAAALQFRDELLKTYSKKYIFKGEVVNDDGYICYVLGEHPLILGRGLIVISTAKTKLYGGLTKLSSKVTYGPIFFVNPEDEI